MRDPLGKAERVWQTLLAMLAQWWRHFGKRPNKFFRPAGSIFTESPDGFIGRKKMKNPREKAANQ
jgi:hypothetical protein